MASLIGMASNLLAMEALCWFRFLLNPGRSDHEGPTMSDPVPCEACSDSEGGSLIFFVYPRAPSTSSEGIWTL